MKVLSPEILLVAKTGLRISFSGSQNLDIRFGESIQASRGLSPWRVNELFSMELGRTEAFSLSPRGSRRDDEEVWRFGSRTDSY